MTAARPHVLITGAARGIGAAIAEALAADGARLSLLGRHRDALQALADRLPGEGHTPIACDVADPAQVEAAFAAARLANGPIEVLINNAGQAESAPAHRTSDALWSQTLAVNLSGTFYGCRAVLPDMLAAKRGRIVNIASTAGQRGYAYVAAYSAAKHGVVGLTRSLALETATRGITVNAVCPGYTETDLLKDSVANIVAKTGRSEAEARDSLAAGNPQHRIVQPAQVVNAVRWLLSDGADAVTGQCISVSGGEVM